MAWIWTDDLARLLIHMDGQEQNSQARHEALGSWLHRPVAIRMNDEDRRRFGLPLAGGVPGD